MPVRMIIEIRDHHETDMDSLREAVVDGLIEELDTPNVEVLDTIEESDPSWARGARF